MKRIIITLAAIIIAVGSASAQDKQHSLEITTGYPSILHMLEYPLTYRSVAMLWEGQELFIRIIVMNKNNNGYQYR